MVDSWETSIARLEGLPGNGIENYSFPGYPEIPGFIINPK